MNASDPIPTSPISNLPRRPDARSRRRRRAQLNIPKDAAGRAALLGSLAHRAYPTYELFVYAVLSGAIIGLGYILDSQALLLFGALVAPLMLPWAGLLLATATGSIRFFLQTFMALASAAVLVFLIGALAGFSARLFLPRTFSEAFVHSRLWWPDLIVLTLGAVIFIVSFVRSESRPFLPSVILAYELFLPLAAGGFGFGSGLPEVWPYGLLVFFVHFAWICMVGLITLAGLRMVPASTGGLVFSGAVGFVLLATLLLLMGAGNWSPNPGVAENSPSAPGSQSGEAVPFLSPSPLPDLATPTSAPFDTPLPATFAPTRERTATPTWTPTAEPTPIYARVHADRGGVVLREVPGGKGIATLDNFTIVEMLPETQDVSGYTWIHVVALQNGNQIEGWVAQLFLETPTPAPPVSSGPTPTPTQ
jgi:hypothetical protein